MKNGCFIKNIFMKEGDERIHAQFVRFGKGEYKGRALLSLMKTSKIKIKSSFEFANDFVILASGLAGKLKISGVILSKDNISNLLSKNNIKGNSETKKGGLFYENNINEQEVEGEVLAEIVGSSYYSLLDIEGEGINLKIKKKLPKPGKGENKADDKFCSLEADLKFWSIIKDYFFWDVDDCNKCKIEHSYEISEIIIPKEEKDPEKMRLNAKRKGKIKRKIIVGKEAEQIKEAELEV